MFRKILFSIFVCFLATQVFATGEPSTYFQIYVPPSGATMQRDAALIVTAIYDSTHFDIIDDGADGDTDDTRSGWLMAGQSYIMYLKDNGINDDSRYASGGTLKWDGDYFIVKSSKLVYAAQSTNSDWQHDWVPSTDKKSIGEKFIIWAPPYTSSKNDINVFAYENNTTITFQKISTTPKTTTGFTTVDPKNPSTVFTRTLNVGEDIIYKYGDGRNVMNPGETYVLISNKPVTVQYGALYGDERDGGGYVPTSNGSSAGSLMYFAVPFQAGTTGEQEIRIVSWDDSNSIQLDRFVNGAWTPVKSFLLNNMKPGDWVGKTNGNVNYPTTFRITCSPGKRVSVFEGDWFETGTLGTSDMATMVSSDNGTSAGTKFLSYMAPPGDEQNCVDPFTGKAFGQQMTHLYIFSKTGATVKVVDANTRGIELNRSYTIAAGRYIDCALTVSDWKKIYNGTGTASGSDRPYLLVTSDNPVSVMNSNFNDNWMCYMGSSLPQSFTQSSIISNNTAIPADTVTVTSTINTTTATVDSASIQVLVQSGLAVISSTFSSSSNPANKINGQVSTQANGNMVSYNNLPSLTPQNQYTVTTQLVASIGSNTGTTLTTTTNATVETVLTGNVAGQLQQSSSTQVVTVDPTNTSKLIFSNYKDNLITKDSTDSWTITWIDINKDGWDDIFVTDRRSGYPNLIYMNNKAGGFTKGQSLISDTAISMSNTWADVDNDGYEDLLVLNNTLKPNTFYHNNKGTLVKDTKQAFTQNTSYYVGGSFADYDNDGKVDALLCNYFPTKYNELYHNSGSNQFAKVNNTVISTDANYSVGATWADYDGDGFPDLFVPNGTGYKNSLFHNDGNGSFTKVQNVISSEGGNSVGSCWGDYDNDGDLDLFVANATPVGNFLYRNDGNGKFTKITIGSVVTDKGSSHGCSFADIDNDGYLDLYVTNDNGLKYLYMNNGDGTFTRKTDELIGYNFGNSFGHAWSDFDHDGDLDLAVATYGKQPNGYFLNNGNSNSWIEINLQGVVSNKSAIGADIFIYANGGLKMREVNSESGFGGKSSFTQHIGLGSISKIDSIKIKWPSGVVQILTNVATRQILTITEKQSVKLNGAVYYDLNKNGIRDNGESLIGRATVQLAPNNTKLYSNNNGYFSVSLDSGSYGLNVLSANSVVPTNSNPTIVNINNTQTSVDTVWLPATTTCNGTDINLVMGGTAIRSGYTNNQFTIILTNNGTQPANNFVMNIKLPVSMSITSPSTSFSAVANSTENNVKYKVYSWNIASMNPFDKQVISFQDGPDATVKIGDVIPITGWVSSLNNECNYNDDTVRQSYTVVGAIDPNEMHVVPVGYGTQGYIMPNQVLTYTVDFQNVGNFPVNTVEITDMLPADLDMSSLQVVSASYDGLSIETHGQQAIFHFNNIYLPDSASNPTASRGTLVFSIRPVQGIAAGTILKNKASVKFENLAPIETNEVMNTIQSKEQEQSMIVVKAYPNPAADVVYLSLVDQMGEYTNKQIQSVVLIDMTGKVLLTKTFNIKEELRFDIPLSTNGFCFVKITDSEGKWYIQKIILERPR